MRQACSAIFSAVLELASFRHFSDIHLAFLDQLTQSIGIVLNTIAATMRTEQLLKQSQALAEQLQALQAFGPNVLGAYVRNARLPLFQKAAGIVVAHEVEVHR